MHFLLGILLFLAIVWILTCTHFGRVVLFVSFVGLVVLVLGGIVVHDQQQANKPSPAEQHAKFCSQAPSAAEYLRMDSDAREVYQSLFKDC